MRRRLLFPAVRPVAAFAAATARPWPLVDTDGENVHFGTAIDGEYCLDEGATSTVSERWTVRPVDPSGAPSSVAAAALHRGA